MHTLYWYAVHFTSYTHIKTKHTCSNNKTFLLDIPEMLCKAT